MQNTEASSVVAQPVYARAPIKEYGIADQPDGYHLSLICYLLMTSSLGKQQEMFLTTGKYKTRRFVACSKSVEQFPIN